MLISRPAPRRGRGFTLTEMMIGLAIFGVLMSLGLPAFSEFLQNARVKNAGEGVMQGLTLARAEAVRRNTNVRFQFVTNLTATCALSSTSLAWIVSTTNPASGCNVAPSPTGNIVQVQSATEGTANIAVTAVDSAATAATTVTFNGLGRVVGTGIATVDIRHTQGVCQHTSASGKVRCLRVLLAPGGQARLCDPKVTAATDSRFCTTS